MGQLPAVGVCSYGNWTFSAYVETVALTVMPSPDSAKRTNVGNRYYIKLKDYIVDTSQGLFDLRMQILRTELTTYARPFVYSGKGLGGLDINTGGLRDLDWGPRPKLLGLKEIAGPLAWEYTWEVEFQKTDCNTSFFAFAVKEFNFKVTFDIAGLLRLTKRTYSGYVTIPQTRINGSRQLSDCVDNYTSLIAPPVPIGYRRETESRTISEDKNRLDFTFADAMLANAPPIGCVDFRVSHSRSNTTPAVFQQWQGVTTAEYTIAQDWPMQIAYKNFLDLVAAELAVVQRAINVAAALGTANAGVVVPWMFNGNAETDTQGRKVSFGFTFMVTTSLGGLLTAGMFDPIPGSDFGLWSASMKLTNRLGGWDQGMRVLKTDDAIVDLCGAGRSTERILRTKNPPSSPPGTRVLTTRCPPPEASWLYYECSLHDEGGSGTAVHTPLPDRVMTTPGNQKVGFDNTGNILPIVTPSKPRVIQQVSGPTIYVIMRGKAARVCYEIERPNLVTVGGVKCFPANRPGIDYFTQKLEGNPGQPIYTATWQLRWVLASTPTQPLSAPASPVIPSKERVLTTGDPPGG